VKVAATPLNVTDVVPTKFVPVIVTAVPEGPLAGVKLVIVGAEAGTVIVKIAVELAVPVPVLTDILPEVAPLGTVAAICVGLLTVNVAAIPLNATPVAPFRFDPVIVTAVETGPEVGAKLEIAGAVEGGGGVFDAALPPPQPIAANVEPRAKMPKSKLELARRR
jgi:hypothetical protein